MLRFGSVVGHHFHAILLQICERLHVAFPLSMRNTIQCPSPPKTGVGAPALLPCAPHWFIGAIPFGVASFVFEACAAELSVSAGMA
eukprot:2901182-Ditylum_brightwellii.AAC.1